MASQLVHAVAETANHSFHRFLPTLALGIVKPPSSSRLGSTPTSQTRCLRTVRSSTVFPNSLSKAKDQRPKTSSITEIFPCKTSTYIPSTAFLQRRTIHTTPSTSVIFKSPVEVETPMTNFFDYVLGDISGAEKKPAVTDGLTGRTIR